MIVAHGTWLPESCRLFLWGEREPHEPPFDEIEGDEEPLHPFQLPPEELDPGFVRLLWQSENDLVSQPATAVLRLPSIEGHPLPSPELAIEIDRSRLASKRLHSWRVLGRALSPSVALGWLAMLPTIPELAERHLRLGSDLRFWSVAARIGLELLARQRFLPSLDRSGDGAAAHWEPLLDREIERFEALERSMPPACRSIVSTNGEQPASAKLLLRSFLSAIVDGFVREAAARIRVRPRFVETSGEKFASALLDEEGELDSPEALVQSLEEQLTAWRAHLDEEPEAPFRFAFRLESPTGPNEEGLSDVAEKAERDEPASSPGEQPVEEPPGFRLRFFLQAVDDESLLVPVTRVWEHESSVWHYLNRRLERPQELVLESLGRASVLFPPLEESLKQPRPEICPLTLDEAFRFLKESAFLLRESGFGVLVPSWWGRREKGLGLHLRVAPKGGNANLPVVSLGLDAMVEFDWQVALGGESLSREEFVQLAELKQPLVQVRGQWVELPAEQVEDVLPVVLSRPARAEMTLREVLRLQFGQKTDDALPIAELEAAGWVRALLTQLAGAEEIPALDPPASFHGTLRPYQIKGLAWLEFLARWELGACLADDMGLGKTIQVLALLLHRIEARADADGLEFPFLLICPTSVVSNWRKEAERFAPRLKVMIHHGLGRREGESFVREAMAHDLVVSTFSLVHRDLERLRAVRWGGLVLDEAQNIKNAQAKQTQAARRLEAPIRIALTGTPVENRLAELWSIMEFLNPGYLGSEAGFKRNFALPIERYRDQEASEDLRKLVRPFVLRRLKTDPTVIKDLPPKNEMKVYCTLTREQATLYEAVVRESMERIDSSEGISRKGEVLAALTRLKQVCNHPAQFLADGSAPGRRSGKLIRLTEMLEEVLAENDRALVFTQYAEMGKLLQRHLREELSVEVLFLHGAVPAAQRETMITRFQEGEPGPPIFVLSLRAGGFGLNLTQARHVFHFDRWWNPAVEDQATDRVFRIGQTRSVAVHKFICAGTIEERVDELIERKKELADTVIRPGEGWLTELSTADLKQLFELRKEEIEI